MTVFSSAKLVELNAVYNAMSIMIKPISQELKLACDKGETGEHIVILRKSFKSGLDEQKKVSKAIAREKRRIARAV